MRAIHGLVWGALLLGTVASHATELPNFKLVPPQANLILQVDRPRHLAERIIRHEVAQQALRLPFVSEAVNTADFERFLQLIAYFEKELGVPWPELIDKLAGGGLTIAARAGGENAPALVIVRGHDESFTRKFVDRLLQVIEQEQIRTESKERTQKASYRGIDGWQLSKDALLTRLGSTLIFTNKNDALKAVIDLHVAGGKCLADRAEIASARKTLPADCHAWLWLDLAYAKESKEAKEQFALPSNDPLQLFIIGGWANTVFRAPYLLVGLYEEGEKFTLSARLPAGRDGMPEAMALHVPPVGVGTLPLLRPKGTLYSQSFYFDVPSIWERRTQLFNDMIAKQFDQAQKDVGKFLPGSSLSKLLTQAGSHHRIVVATHTKKGYAAESSQVLPAFALVTTYRDPKFAKSFEGVLRGAALLATTQLQMKMNDEVHAGTKIVYYRFDEKAKVDGDPDNLRFNFTPCLASLHDQFIICSNIELCRELIDILNAERANPGKQSGLTAFRGTFYATGAADLLKSFEDQLLARVILDQAVRPVVASKRTAEIMEFVRSLGTLELSSTYEAKETRLEATWNRKK